MAKTFAEKMKEVAQNSRDMNKKYPPPAINTGPKTGFAAKSPEPKVYGGSMNKAHPKDVNLPLNTAPKTGFGQMSDKDLSVMKKASKKLAK
jgi:hypothetical protein